MAWSGYFEFGGNEIINAARVIQYAHGAQWFRGDHMDTDLLPSILGHQPYASPLQDDAPWTDPDNTDTYGFYGVYPLDVSGIEDATGTAAVTESTLDGGVVGKVRHATKTVVFNVVLIGQDECATEAGFRWFKTALAGDRCGTTACGGTDLCYLSCNPSCVGNCPPELCWEEYSRSLRDVTVTTGPTITAKRTATDGGAIWTATFTAVAANPFEFGAFRPIIEGFMDPTVDVPWVGGVVPPGASFDDDGQPFIEVTCATPTYQPVLDPKCQYIPPPEAPVISVSCFERAANYWRRQFVLPQQFIPMWGDVVPYIEIHAMRDEVRNLRIRFYADYTGRGDPSTDDPCAFCGDLVVSYIPLGTTMVIDGSDRLTYVIDKGGLRQRSEHLVYGSDGMPFDWPELTCGVPYVVTVDTLQTQVLPTMDLGLYARVV